MTASPPDGPTRTDHSQLYYPYFDWLRAGLAVVVMLGHDGVIDWRHAGSLAVQVFFALSGWLVGGMLIRLDRGDLPRFFFNRSVRIWAPYFVALALLVAASLLKDRVTPAWAEYVVYKATFVYNLFGSPRVATHAAEMPLDGTGNHFWSVNAEEQFYLLAPIFLVLLARVGRRVPFWLLVAAVTWATRTYAAIAFGVLAAVAVANHGPVHRRGGAVAALLAVAAVSAVGLAADWDFALTAPFFSIAVVLLLAVEGRQGPAGRLAGGMSYPLYLNHWIGVFAANAASRPLGLKGTAVSHAASFAFNIALAIALYWMIDRPLLARRSRLYSTRRGWLAMLTGYGLVTTGIVYGLTRR